MTVLFASVALAVSASLALSLLVKATVILVLGLAIARVMWTARASHRFVVLAWTFTVLAALPPAVLFGPAVTIVVDESSVLRPSVSPSMLPSQRRGANHSLVPPPSSGGTMAATDAAVDSAAAGTRSRPPVSADLDSAPVIAAIVWAVGALISLLPIGMTVFRLRRLHRTAREWTGEDPPRLDGIHLLLHEQLSAPMTFGVWRPVILFPADGETWVEADVRRALAHEVEHVRRRDWAVHVLARVVCAVYWFHPLVWQAWRQLTLEADRACDDAVVSGHDAREFAEQLLTLARRMGRKVAAPALSITGGDLTTRVNALLNPNQARGRLGSGVAIAVSAAALFL
jgi:beta-lactamase regulating signal transducer with metallopeptidase domain